MDFDDFTGQVQHRLELPSTAHAVRTIRATLTTLGARLQAGNAADLAASLPMEVDWYLTGAVSDHGEHFDWETFVSRVSEIEGADPADAAHHARVVIDLVHEVVPESDFQQLRDGLPEDEADENWRQLFEVVDAGGWNDAAGSGSAGDAA